VARFVGYFNNNVRTLNLKFIARTARSVHEVTADILK